MNSTTQALTPGLYKWGSTVTITDSVTIDGGGDSNAVWIFQIDNRLVLANAARITLSNGANANNIFWQTAQGVTLEPNSHLEGVVLTQADVAAKTGATMTTRLLAQTAVTLESNDVQAVGPVFETVPVFGLVQVMPQDNRYRSVIYGELEFANGGADRTRAFSHSLGAPLYVQNGVIYSPLYGNLTPNPWNIDDWVVSQFFGLVHFDRDPARYGGWVNSERFDWMKFVEAGNGERFLWVDHLETWLAVHPDGGFHSFDFGWMTPVAGSLTRYNTRIGMVTAAPSNPRGWLISDRFGFVWFTRDGTGTWFWSERRDEWIGITAQGGLWSTKEGRFI